MRKAAVAARLSGFAGFGGGMAAFFADLAQNQSRDWFVANRARFDAEIGGPMELLVTDLAATLAARDIPLRGTPKASIFRMHRDVRFSRDKSPYKTHASAVLTRSGTKHSHGVLYVHLGLDAAFLALGFYAPEPRALGAMREAIVAAPARWREAVARLADAGLAVSTEQMTARLPRGYDAADVGENADWLRLKSFTVGRTLKPAEIRRRTLIERAAEFAEAGMPLLRFGWDAIDSAAGPEPEVSPATAGAPAIASAARRPRRR